MKSLPILMTILSAFFFASCGVDNAKSEEMAKKSAEYFEEIAVSLDKAKDVESAKTSAKEIDATTKKFVTLYEENKDVKNTSNKQKELEDIINPAAKKMGEALASAQVRLASNPEALNIINDAFTKFSSTIEKF